MAITGTQLNNLVLQSEKYPDFIPIKVIEEIATASNPLQDYTPTVNEIYGFIEKIAKTNIFNSGANNPFEILRGEDIENGNDIEELHLDLLKGSKFDGARNVFARVDKTNIHKCYHKLNQHKTFTDTIYDDDLKRIFTKSNIVSDFEIVTVSNLYDSATHSDYLLCKQLLCDMSQNENIRDTQKVSISGETNADIAKSLIKELQRYVKKMQYVSSDYNASQAITSTSFDNLVIVLDSDVALEINFEVLANLFNVEYATLRTKIIEVDNFNELTDLKAVIFDKRGFIWHRFKYDFFTRPVPENYYRNLFLNNFATMSFSLLRNIVFFEVPNPNELKVFEDTTQTSTAFHEKSSYRIDGVEEAEDVKRMYLIGDLDKLEFKGVKLEYDDSDDVMKFIYEYIPEGCTVPTKGKGFYASYDVETKSVYLYDMYPTYPFRNVKAYKA